MELDEDTIGLDEIEGAYEEADDVRKLLATKALNSPAVTMMTLEPEIEEGIYMYSNVGSPLFVSMVTVSVATLAEEAAKEEEIDYYSAIREVLYSMTRQIHAYGQEKFGWEEEYQSFLADIATDLNQWYGGEQ